MQLKILQFAHFSIIIQVTKDPDKIITIQKLLKNYNLVKIVIAGKI